jgi:uncharacterized protein YcaQ
VKIATEFMLDVGEVICVERRGWKRVYDLPARILPADLIGREPADDDCHIRLVRLAGQALGVADLGDLAEYHRLRRDEVARAVEASELVPVSVEGWRGPAWADPEALAAVDIRGRHRTTLLSPFDSLIWDRRRTQRLFGFSHALEAYKPRGQRKHGYYAMPLLVGGQLLGRVDPKRVNGTLVAQQVSLDTPRALEPTAVALREAASWVGCDDIRVERVEPAELTTPLKRAVAAV